MWPIPLNLLSITLFQKEMQINYCIVLYCNNCRPLKTEDATYYITGIPSSLYEPLREHIMASNYKGLYGIFYKISMKVVKSENIQ